MTFPLPALRRWLLAALALCSFLVPQFARAADLSAGATLNGSTATLWMKSSVGSTWADAHYNVNGGAPQNVRMAWNTATSQFETTFPASAGQTVNYQFTYNVGSAAYDSAWASTVLAGTWPACTSFFTVLSSVSRLVSADLTDVAFAWPIALVSSVVAVDRSAERTDCDFCALRSSIALLYAVSAVPA